MTQEAFCNAVGITTVVQLQTGLNTPEVKVDCFDIYQAIFYAVDVSEVIMTVKAQKTKTRRS